MIEDENIIGRRFINTPPENIRWRRCVGTGRNDTLAWPHFDNAGSPSILPQREKHDVVAYRDYWPNLYASFHNILSGQQKLNGNNTIDLI